MPKNKKKHAIFILTHGRPDNVFTHKTMRSNGYTGEIYFIVDNEDSTIEEYKRLYKDKVIVFDKASYASKFDIMDNFAGRGVIVFARNACYDIARELWLDYFFEYEDDYTNFSFRHIENGVLLWDTVRNMDKVFEIMIETLEITKADTLAFAQGGDLIGGSWGFLHNMYKRKAMNTFLFRVNKDSKDDILFTGRMNDDVNMYLTQGSIGKLIFQNAYITMVQVQTQKNAGGNTESYKKYGTYVKSFYSVMAMPSACQVSIMGRIEKRLHHRISWKYAVPKILDEKYKKV